MRAPMQEKVTFKVYVYVPKNGEAVSWRLFTEREFSAESDAQEFARSAKTDFPDAKILMDKVVAMTQYVTVPWEVKS